MILKEGISIEKLSWHQKILLKKELKAKCQFFQQLGYSSVNEAELMNYLVGYRWKKNTPQSLKACREDILHIEPNEFFDYQQLKAQTSSLKINDWHDLEDLF
ncbi:post-transcriptional regulator [Enterococcus sp. 5H]|uniref:post-transcriptional regulator n=1 Tax=Enterococcus sp. 5H TaxID=1229490 RepID=UPI002302A326|nr:post-transcriptional regulator [Enterococcus sp. 5H]